MKNHLLPFSSPEKWEEEDNIDLAFYDVNEYQKEYTQLINENLTLKIIIENLLKRLRMILKSSNIKEEITNIMIENEQKMAYYQKHSGNLNQPNLFYSNSSTQTYFTDNENQNKNINDKSKFTHTEQKNENQNKIEVEYDFNKTYEKVSEIGQKATNYDENPHYYSEITSIPSDNINKSNKTDSNIRYLSSKDSIFDYDQEIEILRNQLGDQINENDRLRKQLKKQEKQKESYSLSCKRLIHELNKSTIADTIEFNLSGLNTDKSPLEIEECVNNVIKARRNKNEEIMERIETKTNDSSQSETFLKTNEGSIIMQQREGYQTIQLCKIVNNTVRTCVEQLKQQHDNIISHFNELIS